MKAHTFFPSVVASLALLAVAPRAALAAGDGAVRLNANEVARRARETSPDLEVKRAEVLAASALVDQALVAFAPRVGVVARYTRLSDIDPPLLGILPVAPGVPEGPIPAGTPLVNVATAFPVILNQGTFAATLAVPLSDYVLRLAQAKGAASGNERAAKVAEEATKLKIASDARLLYYGTVRAKLAVPVAEQAVAAANEHKKDVTHAFEAGQASRADVLRVESQVADADQLLLRTKNLADVYDAQLSAVLHESGVMSHDVGEELEREAQLPDVLGAPTALVDEAYSARLEPKVLDASSKALADQVSATKAGAYPRIDLVGDVTAQNPNNRYIPQQTRFYTTWAVSAQLTWTPNDTFASLAAARAVAAKKAQVDAEATKLKDGIRIEVAQAIEAVRNAKGARETSARALAAAEEGYRVRRALFQSGRATSTELTDAETELTRARLAALSAKVDARIAEVRLDHATGRDRART